MYGPILVLDLRKISRRQIAYISATAKVFERLRFSEVVETLLLFLP